MTIPSSTSAAHAARDAQSPNAAVEEDVDVAIFGAGPAGLTTALAIIKACPDLQVHVYERAKAFRPSGGCLGLSSPNVFQCWRAIDPAVEEAVKEAGLSRRDFITGDMDAENRTTSNIESTIIAWNELQKALLSCMPSRSMVSLGCELSHIEEEGEGVLATMADGRRVRAKLLVGADGNRSVARKFVQGGTQAEYVGAAVWRFFLPGGNPFVEVSDTLSLTGNGKIIVMQPVKRQGEVLTYCSGITGFDEDRLHELNQTRYIQESNEDTQQLSDKLQRFKEQFEGFNPDILAYILKHAVPESVLEHPMYALDPHPDWVKGNVALVGDAAHVMPPNLSQGTPQAIEDAVQLAASLMQQGGICAAALSHYESARKQRVIPIWEVSKDMAVQYYKNKDMAHNPMKDKNMGDSIKFILEYEPPCLSPGLVADAV